MGSVSKGHSKQPLIVTCPECGGELTVDSVTGAVVFHKPAPSTSGAAKDFDRLLADIDDSKTRAQEIFQREISALKDRDRLMEEKFQEALRRAEEEPDDKPPVRPWDLD